MGQGPHLRQETLKFVCLKARLRRLPFKIHFQQHRLPDPCFLRPLIDLLRQFEAIDRMDQVEDPHDRPGLAPLQMTDKMPLDRQSPQRLDFGKRLLQAVLTEDRQSRRDPLADLLQPHRFRRRDEAHSPFGPSGSLRRMPDPLEHVPNILTD